MAWGSNEIFNNFSSSLMIRVQLATAFHALSLSVMGIYCIYIYTHIHIVQKYISLSWLDLTINKNSVDKKEGPK